MPDSILDVLDFGGFGVFVRWKIGFGILWQPVVDRDEDVIVILEHFCQCFIIAISRKLVCNSLHNTLFRKFDCNDYKNLSFIIVIKFDSQNDLP